ncbi:thyroxine-binding globulin-like [Psammomys obesus]|uniref:thyroxine-binding globulin-like n=1 Tax=Psammomys obesus TaxID=48139 RepID=UPI002453618E|nr:thyroxine-binding globulin-like [Psammomys obesus]
MQVASWACAASHFSYSLFLGDVSLSFSKKRDYHPYFLPNTPSNTFFGFIKQAQQEINSCVEKQTKGKIVGLIQDLKLNAIMILVNYIHFKGKASRLTSSLVFR